MAELVGHRPDRQHLLQLGHFSSRPSTRSTNIGTGSMVSEVISASLMHVGVVVERAERVQRRTPVALGLAGAEDEEHLGPVQREQRARRAPAGAERLERLDVLADPLGGLAAGQRGVAEVHHRLVPVPLERGHHQVAVVGPDRIVVRHARETRTCFSSGQSRQAACSDAAGQRSRRSPWRTAGRTPRPRRGRAAELLVQAARRRDGPFAMPRSPRPRMHRQPSPHRQPRTCALVGDPDAAVHRQDRAKRASSRRSSAPRSREVRRDVAGRGDSSGRSSSSSTPVCPEPRSLSRLGVRRGRRARRAAHRGSARSQRHRPRATAWSRCAASDDVAARPALSARPSSARNRSPDGHLAACRGSRPTTSCRRRRRRPGCRGSAGRSRNRRPARPTAASLRGDRTHGTGGLGHAVSRTRRPSPLRSSPTAEDAECSPSSTFARGSSRQQLGHRPDLVGRAER